jgi:hypothetical protein
MGQDNDVFQLIQLGVPLGRSRLVAENIEPCSVNHTVLERVDEGILVDLPAY